MRSGLSELGIGGLVVGVREGWVNEGGEWQPRG